LLSVLLLIFLGFRDWAFQDSEGIGLFGIVSSDFCHFTALFDLPTMSVRRINNVQRRKTFLI